MQNINAGLQGVSMATIQPQPCSFSM